MTATPTLTMAALAPANLRRASHVFKILNSGSPCAKRSAATDLTLETTNVTMATPSLGTAVLQGAFLSLAGTASL